MKLPLLAHALLLGLTVGACMAPPFDPQDRFASIKDGMTREQVENRYGPPTHWVVYYDTGFAVFSYDRLLSTSSLDNQRQKPDWLVKEGMSVREVQRILGSPVKACAGEYYTEPCQHWFCYKHDVLISKERRPSSF
jgi:hypothetical protein